jgi:uncharacterized DUF497 family protein
VGLKSTERVEQSESDRAPEKRRKQKGSNNDTKEVVVVFVVVDCCSFSGFTLSSLIER